MNDYGTYQNVVRQLGGLGGTVGYNLWEGPGNNMAQMYGGGGAATGTGAGFGLGWRW